MNDHLLDALMYAPIRSKYKPYFDYFGSENNDFSEDSNEKDITEEARIVKPKALKDTTRSDN